MSQRLHGDPCSLWKLLFGITFPGALLIAFLHQDRVVLNITCTPNPALPAKKSRVENSEAPRIQECASRRHFTRLGAQCPGVCTQITQASCSVLERELQHHVKQAPLFHNAENCHKRTKTFKSAGKHGGASANTAACSGVSGYLRNSFEIVAHGNWHFSLWPE